MEVTEELLTVLEADLTIRVNSNEYTLKNGDSIRFKADILHVYHKKELSCNRKLPTDG